VHEFCIRFKRDLQKEYTILKNIFIKDLDIRRDPNTLKDIIDCIIVGASRCHSGDSEDTPSKRYLPPREECGYGGRDRRAKPILLRCIVHTVDFDRDRERSKHAGVNNEKRCF
jgi:hypothetical protein